MNKLRLFFPLKGEDFKTYVDRITYAIRRRVNPSLKVRHRREWLVGPIGYWEPLRAYQFGFLKSRGLEPHHTLMDVGCGPLQGGLKSIEHLEPGRYVGMDVNTEPLAEGYKQILENDLVHKNPTLIRTDSFGEEELGPRQFDFFWASQTLYHLSPEYIETLLRVVSRRMKPTSAFYGDIIDYTPDDIPEAYWHEFKYYRHKPNWLQQAAAKAGVKLEILGQLLEFGYPKEVSLHKNYMLKFTPVSDK
jgi:SAM-dependent methyltransferase